MTAKKKNRAPAKGSAPKLPVKVPAASKDKAPTVPTDTGKASLALVAPLSGQALNLVMQIIDNADFKGREVSQVLGLKIELARAAGIKQQQPGMPGSGQ